MATRVGPRQRARRARARADEGVPETEAGSLDAPVGTSWLGRRTTVGVVASGRPTRTALESIIYDYIIHRAGGRGA